MHDNTPFIASPAKPSSPVGFTGPVRGSVGANHHHTILFVTDHQAQNRFLIDALIGEKFSVRLHQRNVLSSGNPPADEYDLILIDAPGCTLCDLSTYARLRSVSNGLLMLLVDGLDETFQILLYEQGIDDLLIKPIHHVLLLARIRARLRHHTRKSTSATLAFNGLEINRDQRKVSYQNREIPFTTREFDLLCHLARHARTTLDRDHLYKAVLGIEYNGYDRAIDMYITRIRARLAPYPHLARMIKTVRGTGYLFAAD